MGNIVAFGLLYGLVVVFILLIAILAKRPPTRAGRLMVSGEAMRRFSGWVIRQRRMIFVLFPVLALGAVLGIRNIEYDDNVIRYFDDRYPLRQDSEAIESGLTGLEALQFSFSAPDGASVFDPVFLRSVDRFAKWIDNQPEVVSVAALTSILRDLNRNMSGDGGDPDGVADTQAANAQLMMFYELSLPVGMDLNILMDVDRTQTLVTATVRAGRSEELRDLARRADAWIAENEPTLSAHASGAAIAFARISERNNEQMIWGFLTALGLVSATMIVTLRSIRHGLLSLVPNLLPALLGFGFWGWTLGDVNLGSTVVTTMTFGIVVDDTVHFLMHYLACRRRGHDVEGALADTFAVVGSAIILTSVALIMGFAILITSGFAINQHIGLLTAVVIVFALICDLLLLPALLTLSRKRE
ncbi:RND family transporter [Marimonas sp. MJW-29]|uniref:RND family transporter n=1 Tax=Sulfitobacter sediminis TaxID=3234186 RepID=A0ABV3RMN6_9RHOB